MSELKTCEQRKSPSIPIFIDPELPELKSCPFCGSKVVDICDGSPMSTHLLFSKERRFFWIGCCECQADGPKGRFKTKEAAIAAWNKRIKEE